jgi:transposase InsO family protein
VKINFDTKHKLPIAPNLPDRNFTPAAPNLVWTSDIPYLRTDEGWLYLAIVLDLFNREVVGWSLKPRMTAEIVTDALTMACATVLEYTMPSVVCSKTSVA